MIGLVLAALASPIEAAPPSSGSVSVTVADDVGAQTSDTLQRAIGAALARRDFVILPGHARYALRVDIAEEAIGVAPVRSGRGGSAFAPTGMAVSLPSKKTRLVDLVRIRLTMRLAGDDGRPVWQATAVTVRPRGAAPLARLVDAAFAGYPATAPGPVSVP